MIVNYVYKITNNINQKYYIGVHKQNTLKKDVYFGSSKLLNNSIIKYGIDNFTKKILKYFNTYEEALLYEKELVTINEVNNNLCYNLKVGGIGGGTHNRKLSIEHKKKLSIKLKNKIPWNVGLNMSNQMKDKCSKRMYGNKYSLGRIESNETKEKKKIAWSKRPILICPHCGLESRSASNMSRYHFDNCKHKLTI